MRDSIGAPTHHARRPRAIAAVAAFLSLAAPALAQDDPLVQRGIPAEATAANAVVARERAIANAQRLAYRRMAAAAGISPNASDRDIEAAVSSLVVESERTTLNGYQGRLTVRFSPARVASLGGRVSSSSDPAAAPSRDPAPSAPPGGGETAAFVPPAGYTPGAGPRGSASAFLDAGTDFRSLNEWVALRRQLLSQPSVTSVDIVAISTDGALLRIGLRSPPAVAAPELAGNGILLAPVAPNPGASRGAQQPGWRVGLAGGA